MLYSGNIFSVEDTQTCVYFLSTFLPQRLSAIKVIQLGPTTPRNVNAIMAVIQKASHMMTELRQICILTNADAGLPDVWQNLDGHFQHLEVTTRLTDWHNGESCLMWQ